MTEAQKDTYIAWLNDAHAMEESLVKTLEKQIEEAPEDVPEVKVRLQEHLEETKGHAEKVRACIERNGGTVSAVKDFAGRAKATVEGFSMSVMGDALVKNMHNSYVAENFEIAMYLVIRTVAEELNDEEAVMMCDDILNDEEMMAQWLLEQLPEIVTRHMTLPQE